MTRTQKLTLASIVAVAFAYLLLAWSRRWMSDDGLIVVRTVRQVLDGNGPTFNAFERAESNTSTLWMYLLVIVAGITRLRIEYVAVFLGIILAVGALLLGMDATRRMLRGRGSTAIIAPAGGLIMVGIFPYWDYASSGLETGLCFAWLALCWWLLVRDDRPRLAAVIFGLGPLVRPDLGIGAVMFFASMWLLRRPPWRTTLKLLGLGVALPVAYEIFRAGYYGALVPLPALAKSATESAWSRGWAYLVDSVQPYMMWLPVAVAAAVFAFVVAKRAVKRRDLILIGAPIVTGFVNAIYVMRVGGDFMYARMLLVPLFALMLPAFVLPIRKFTIPAIGVLGAWALYAAIAFGDGESHTKAKGFIEDERFGYVAWTGKKHPIHGRVFVRADRPASDTAKTALANGQRIFISQLGFTASLDPQLDSPIVYAAGRLGTGGAVVPLDAIVADTLGLANPLGARITPTLPGFTGHEKVLPWAWMLADFGDPAHDDDNVENTPGYLIRAARRAMQCGELKELLDSARAPMSASRFWSNLTGSVRRTRLVIPNDPIEADQKFCGNTTIPVITVSSLFPFDGWSKYGLVDGIRESTKTALGHTSKPRTDNATEWVELKYAAPRAIRKVLLYPATGGEGFPVDFTIQFWEAGKWVVKFRETDFKPDKTEPHVFELPAPVSTDRIRIESTKLRFLRDEYVMQLGEIELAP